MAKDASSVVCTWLFSPDAIPSGIVWREAEVSLEAARPLPAHMSSRSVCRFPPASEEEVAPGDPWNKLVNEEALDCWLLLYLRK